MTDTVLQEVYARLLVAEAREPGVCSMTTLRALRYMDRRTADGFARVAAITLNEEFLPNNVPLLQKYDVPFSLLLELDDASLIAAHPIGHKTRQGALLRSGCSAIRFSSNKQENIPAYGLRIAGQDFARVAQVDVPDGYLREVLQWLRGKFPDADLSWAQIPTRRWTGNVDSLEWNDLSHGDGPG